VIVIAASWTPVSSDRDRCCCCWRTSVARWHRELRNIRPAFIASVDWDSQ